MQKRCHLIKDERGELAVFFIIVVPTIVATIFGFLSFNSKATQIKHQISQAIDSSLLYVSQLGMNGEILDSDGNKHYICTFPNPTEITNKFEAVAKAVFFKDGIESYNSTWKFTHNVVTKDYIDTFNLKVVAYVPKGAITNYNSFYQNNDHWNKGDIANVPKGSYYTFTFEASTQCRGKR